MLSVTGVVTDDSDNVKNELIHWKHRNFEWLNPVVLNLPELSIKERLQLERLLPGKTVKKQMSDSLGYDPASGLDQYRDYFYLLPTFAKLGW